MNNTDIKNLLNSDELFSDIMAASTTSSTLRRMEKNKIVKHLHKQYWSKHKHFKYKKYRVLKSYIEKIIEYSKYDDKYIHEKTVPIYVGMYLLLKMTYKRNLIKQEDGNFTEYYTLSDRKGKNRIVNLVKDMSVRKEPKFFFCSRFAAELIKKFNIE